jgi:hypothetical protein
MEPIVHIEQPSAGQTGNTDIGNRTEHVKAVEQALEQFLPLVPIDVQARLQGVVDDYLQDAHLRS